MNYRSTLLMLGLLSLGFVIQSGLSTSGQEQIEPPKEMSGREANLEHELMRLRNTVAGMGENHPYLKITQQKISSIQAELVALSRGDGPFAEALVADRAEVEVLLRQMSDYEVRQAVLNLYGQVKDLQRRLDRLEQPR